MKSLKFKWLFVVLLVLNISFSQENDEVLLKVGDASIKASEFLRVYNKNLDLVKDESQKDIDGYLKLFTEYQLKLQEAKHLKLDEDKNYKREFTRYKKQLIKNYISENKVTDELVEEAYKRSKIDINASHALVRLDANAKDTIAAYNQVLAIRDRVLKEGYKTVQADMHNGETVFLEDLGYFSAFKMVYDFESAAYNTPVGEISMPFRTQFGYHVVMINDKRTSRGTITAAHIMISESQKDSLTNPENRIQTIYKKLNQGESFEALAKQFSEDKSSANNGGKLTPFKSGQLSSTKFEDEAFSLKNNGDYSKPFKTAYGWHIVKRIDLKEIAPFEDVKAFLVTRVKRDSRSKLINEAMLAKLKKKYKIEYNSKAKSYFTNLLNDKFYTRGWEVPKDLNKAEPIFTINNSPFTYNAFAKHLFNSQRLYANNKLPFATIVDKEFDAFFETSVFKYREENLELENKDYANILKEYRDGLLLFDLMEKEIWNKASKDTLGLETYYNDNKSNYKWEDRVDVVIATSSDKSNLKKLRKLMKKGKSEEEIKEALNKNDQENVIFTKGIYNVTNPILPTDFKAKQGLSDVYNNHNEAYHIINVKEVIPSRVKTFEEARGLVVNDYQAVLESNWIQDLYSRYNVQINDGVLKSVKSKLIN
ncbi:peptidylprolyl isomerase [Winogradskyella endarachnes]|uniref:Peptidylprolyl isomerase n=1 Tax=Winogradskyella endarachnes TaxID=2681965 RepID=A0A6L6UG59_9FLAO|nr:peptidylprolyl isomerase [Winogradskyella endarachnes]MUU79777.1 peptidylprolyl isomerase [Winogradskyella endarachnes]